MVLDNIIVFFAEYAPYIVAVSFALFVLLRKDSVRERALFLLEGLSSAFVARGAVELIRLFIHRPRPFVADSSLLPLFYESSFSFPSGHAAFFFALSTSVFLFNRRLGILFYAVSALIGAARVFANVHYASDIFAGALLGALIGCILFFIFKFIKNKYV